MIFNKIFFGFSLFISHSLFAQTNNSNLVYNFHDHSIGAENLSLNNGKIHTNYDITLNNENRYLETSNFVTGNLNYNNQDYFNQKLKYDILKDELVFSPTNESEYIKVNVIKENICSFFIYNKKFIRLNDKEFNGFFEEHFAGVDKTLYIKHYKEAQDLIKNTKVYSQYFYKQKYILEYKNVFIEINSRRSVVKIFPEYESKINDFFESNDKLKKENETKFMENLIKFINNFSSK